jgi:hypothetical protein
LLTTGKANYLSDGFFTFALEINMSGGDGNLSGLGHNGGTTGHVNGTAGPGGPGTNSGGWEWADVPATWDADGHIRINFAGRSINIPTTGGKGGSGGGTGSGIAGTTFTANVAGWHEGPATTGSMNSPSIAKVDGSKYDQVHVSFGRDQYMPAYDAATDTWQANYIDGDNTNSKNHRTLMNVQAISVAQLYVINQNEKSLLLKASDIISSAGSEIASTLGAQFKAFSDELANDIKAFQGKTLRSYNDALTTLNSLTGNPALNFSAADKAAAANALKQINVKTIAQNLGGLAKCFTIADRLIKVDSIVEKTVEGIQTGDWSPLAAEVEAMAASGIAGGLALGVVTAFLGTMAAETTVVTAFSIVAIMFISVLTSYIDADLAHRVNVVIGNFVRK